MVVVKREYFSLWRTVSLKNTRIYDWDGFVQFFNRTQSGSLDLRKMTFVKERDQTWQDLLDVSERFQALTSVELPRVPGPVLTGLLSGWSQLETLHVPLVSPPFNINSLASLSHLREVRLKATAGSSISITHRISGQSITTSVSSILRSYMFRFVPTVWQSQLSVSAGAGWITTPGL